MAVVALERAEAGLEIFLHRQQRKDLAALRHEADAAPCALVGFQAGDVVAVERDRPARDRVLADHRTQQRGLADAVAAEHTGHLARLRRQRDATQGLRCAVVEIDVFYDQHRQPFANSEWRVANSQKKYSIRYSLLAIR